jgi:MFS family permease
VLAREYFGQRIMGTVFGAATMGSSLGMAFGPLALGWVFDTFDAYSWLYIGSTSVALGAVAVALAFPLRARDALQTARAKARQRGCRAPLLVFDEEHVTLQTQRTEI